MDSYVLTKKNEYKLGFYISICLFVFIIPCFIYMLYMSIYGKPLIGLLLITLCPLYNIFRFLTFKEDNNYYTLLIDDEGLLIRQSDTNEKLKWNQIKSISFHLGKWRLDGLVMDVSVIGKKRITFSFFNYTPGVSIKEIKKAILFFSKNPAIIKRES